MVLSDLEVLADHFLVLLELHTVLVLLAGDALIPVALLLTQKVLSDMHVLFRNVVSLLQQKSRLGSLLDLRVVVVLQLLEHVRLLLLLPLR